jgi:acyl-CoA synthetase (AMP-forming)/AMP-acid ligase II
MTTMFEIVSGWATTQPDAYALISETDGTRTYGQLAHNAAAFGAALLGELGHQPGETMTILGANSPEWVEAYLGAGAAGQRCVAGNPEWTDEEVGFVIEHSQSVGIVCDASLASRMVALAGGFPRIRHVISLTPLAGGDPVPAGAISYADLLARAPADPASELPSEAFAFTAHIMYTSGTTTGRPKAVVAQIAQPDPDDETPVQTTDYIEMFGIEPKDRSIVITPFFHGNGFGGFSSALTYGASAVFPRRFSASRFWHLVDLYRPTYLFTLVPLVNILLGRPPGAHEKRHNLRVLIVLGAAYTTPVIEERFGAPVIDWYGMTEAGSGTYTRLNEPRKPGSAGRRFPNSAMVILREDGTEADPFEVGEVCFGRATISFDGYLRDEEATSAVLDQSWFHTGDLGYFDDEGYFFFVDRKKDIVRRGGENISSMEIEGLMRRHPDVADAAIVGKPDPVLGERVVAFVVPAEGVAEPDTGSIQAFVGQHLAHFKVPEEIYYVDELPRTSTGKIIKKELRGQLPAEPAAG